LVIKYFYIEIKDITLKDISEGMWLRLLQKHLHTHVCCSTIHNSQVMETARMPTTDEWIKNMWYLHTTELYSAIKENEILSFSGKWIELENIILSEVTQAQKAKNHMFFLVCSL
jgi:hypothetical protein